MHTVILKIHLFIVQISLYNVLYKNIVYYKDTAASRPRGPFGGDVFMLYRIWPLLKEVYHYEKHLILFSNTALIVMGLLWLVHLPLLSRILAVADFTDRHRRRGETDAQIAAALRERAGHAFDPQCVEVMCGMLTEKM